MEKTESHIKVWKLVIAIYNNKKKKKEIFII